MSPLLSTLHILLPTNILPISSSSSASRASSFLDSLFCPIFKIFLNASAAFGKPLSASD